MTTVGPNGGASGDTLHRRHRRCCLSPRRQRQCCSSCSPSPLQPRRRPTAPSSPAMPGPSSLSCPLLGECVCVFERGVNGERERVERREGGRLQTPRRASFARSPFFFDPSLSFFLNSSTLLTLSTLSLSLNSLSLSQLSLSTPSNLKTLSTSLSSASATTATSTSRSPNGSTGTRRAPTASTSSGSRSSPPTPRPPRPSPRPRRAASARSTRRGP